MRALSALFLLFAAGPAAAEMNYVRCIEMAEIDPGPTRAQAIDWHARTGDPAALHCEAAALAALGAERSAANKLLEAAGSPRLPAEARAEILAQASGLWRSLGEADAALEAIEGALALRQAGAYHKERAMLLAGRLDWDEAQAALNAALTLEPRDAEALALRAAARRRLGDAAAARRDALDAIEIRPISPAAWFELGKAERALGIDGGARRAWLKTIDLAPSGPFAAMARAALQEMDGG